jgi:branched-chain amino acid transport system substrate-binding protein
MQKRAVQFALRQGLGMTVGLSLSLAAFSVMGAPQTIKLGLVAPITGLDAIMGIAEQHGVQMAVDEINSSGGIAGRKIEVDLADSGLSNATAVSAVIKVIDDGVVAIMGSPKSTQNIAIAPTLKKSGIPTLFASTATVVTTLGAPMWRLVVSDAVSIPAAVIFAKNTLHKSKIGLMTNNDDYGNSSTASIEQAAKLHGLTIVAQEKFSPATRDFAPQLLKIKNAGADVLMVYSYPLFDAAILKQRGTLGVTMPVIGGNPMTQASVLHLLTAAEANGAYGVGTRDPTVAPSPVVKAWIDKFEHEFHTPVDPYSAAYYDGVMLIKKAIEAEKGATDPTSIKKGLLSIKNYQGISSSFTCAPSGNCAHIASIVQNQGKTPMLVKEIRQPGY